MSNRGNGRGGAKRTHYNAFNNRSNQNSYVHFSNYSNPYTQQPPAAPYQNNGYQSGYNNNLNAQNYQQQGQPMYQMQMMPVHNQNFRPYPSQQANYGHGSYYQGNYNQGNQFGGYRPQNQFQQGGGYRNNSSGFGNFRGGNSNNSNRYGSYDNNNKYRRTDNYSGGGYHNKQPYNNKPYSGRGGFHKDISFHDYKGPKLNYDEKIALDLTEDQINEFQEKGMSPLWTALEDAVEKHRSDHPEKPIIFDFSIHYGNRFSRVILGDTLFKARLELPSLYNKRVGKNCWKAKHIVCKQVFKYFNINPDVVMDKGIKGKKLENFMKKFDVDEFIEKIFGSEQYRLEVNEVEVSEKRKVENPEPKADKEDDQKDDKMEEEENKEEETEADKKAEEQEEQEETQPHEEMSIEPKEAEEEPADDKKPKESESADPEPEKPKPAEYETVKVKKFKCQIFLNDQVQHTSVKNTEQEVINYCKIGFLNKNKVKVMTSCEKGFLPPKTKKDKDLIFNLKEENDENHVSYSNLIKQGHDKECSNEAYFVLAKDKYSKNYFELSLIKAAVELKLEYSYEFKEGEEEFQVSKRVRKDQSQIDEEMKGFNERKAKWEEEQAKVIAEDEEKKEDEAKEESQGEETNAKNAENEPEKPEETNENAENDDKMEEEPKKQDPPKPKKPLPFPEKFEYYHTIEETKTRPKVTCTMTFGDFKNLVGYGLNKIEAKAAISAVLVRKLDSAYGWIVETPQWDVKWSKLLENQVRKDNGRPSNWDDDYYGENCLWIAEQEAKKKEAAKLAEERKKKKEEEEAAKKAKEEEEKAAAEAKAKEEAEAKVKEEEEAKNEPKAVIAEEEKWSDNEQEAHQEGEEKNPEPDVKEETNDENAME